MDDKRRLELERDISLRLTPEESAEGWFFCVCEWDGMLINDSWKEAKFCECRSAKYADD